MAGRIKDGDRRTELRFTNDTRGMKEIGSEEAVRMGPNGPLIVNKRKTTDRVCYSEQFEHLSPAHTYEWAYLIIIIIRPCRLNTYTEFFSLKPIAKTSHFAVHRMISYDFGSSKNRENLKKNCM